MTLRLAMEDLALSATDALVAAGRPAPVDVIVEHFLPAVDCTDALFVYFDGGDIMQRGQFPRIGDPFDAKCMAKPDRRLTVRLQLFRPCAPTLTDLRAVPDNATKETFAGNLADDIDAIENGTIDLLHARAQARGWRPDRTWWPSIVRPLRVSGGTAGCYWNYYINNRELR